MSTRPREKTGRVGHDHLVPVRFETPRDPLALGRRLNQNARPGAATQMLRECLAGRGNPLLDERAVVRADADLTCDLVHVDANLLHGWPPLAALTASL
jgi:hypothetical protein